MNTAEIDVLATIDNAYVQGIDTWELMVSAATDDEQTMAVLRWRQGDIALRIDKRYGGHAIETFAQDIGTPHSTVKLRYQMSGFYELAIRVAFPNLFYSHYRAAMKFGDIDKATRALDKASLRGWTYGRFEYFVKRCLGKGANKSEKIEGEISRRYQQEDGYYLVVKLDSDHGLQAGQIVILKAKES